MDISTSQADRAVSSLYRPSLLGTTCVFVVAHVVLTFFCVIHYFGAAAYGLRGNHQPSTPETFTRLAAIVLCFPLGYLPIALRIFHPIFGLFCLVANSVSWGIWFHIGLGRLDDWLGKHQPHPGPIRFPPLSDKYRPDQSNDAAE